MGSETLPDVTASHPTIGNYVLESEIGRGGMGAVYVGVHKLIGKRAAIKVLLPALSQNKDLVQRFFNEARAATQVKHPGIVEVHDFGVGPDGNAYIVMEHLEGESLASRLTSQGRVAVPIAVGIARQTALALAAAHRAGIVHRDLKPDNIYLVPDAEVAGGERVKLLDFGIAKLADQQGTGPAQTVTGAILGTPQYMSPEQCEGSRVIDHRSDLYSLGCTLFQMLTGRLPFVETGIGGLIGAHLHMAPPHVRSIDPNIPDALDAIVDRLLAKSPDARFASADEVGAALTDPSAGGTTGARPIPFASLSGGSTPTPPPMISSTAIPQTPKKRKWLVPVAVIVVLGGGAAAFAVVRSSGDDKTTVADASKTEPKVDPSTVEKTAEIPIASGSQATETKPTDGKPTDGKPTDGKPTDAKPTDAKPTDATTPAKPTELKPNDAKPKPTEPKPNDPLASNPSQPGSQDFAVAIKQAYARGDYVTAFGACKSNLPVRADLVVQCVVSACQLKRRPAARLWVTNAMNRGLSQPANVALNECLALGLDLAAMPDRPNRRRR